MPAVIPAHRIVCYTVPKVASTSIKILFHDIATGGDFMAGRGPEAAHEIHGPGGRSPGFHRTDRDAFGDHLRLAVVRDPIERFLSAYSNRVLGERLLGPEAIDLGLAERLGIEPDPTVRRFVMKLDLYRALSPAIRKHTQPAAFFLGPDLGWYDRVFPIGRIGEMVALVSARVGRPLVLPREMQGGRKIAFAGLPADVRDRLRDLCAADYGFLRDHYRPPPGP